MIVVDVVVNVVDVVATVVAVVLYKNHIRFRFESL